MNNLLQGKWLLVVDDDQASRMLLRILMVASGARVCEAETGAQAVAAHAQQRFDVILMDVRMPDMDGREATIRIRQADQDTGRRPTLIIGVTAHAMADEQRHCLHVGMNAVTTKPIDPDSIVKEILRCFETHDGVQPEPTR